MQVPTEHNIALLSEVTEYSSPHENTLIGTTSFQAFLYDIDLHIQIYTLILHQKHSFVNPIRLNTVTFHVFSLILANNDTSFDIIVLQNSYIYAKIIINVIFRNHLLIFIC